MFVSRMVNLFDSLDSGERCDIENRTEEGETNLPSVEEVSHFKGCSSWITSYFISSLMIIGNGYIQYLCLFTITNHFIVIPNFRKELKYFPYTTYNVLVACAKWHQNVPGRWPPLLDCMSSSNYCSQINKRLLCDYPKNH